MSSLIELLVVLPLLVGILAMDDFAIGEVADAFDCAKSTYSGYIDAMRAQHYSLDKATGNSYPFVGGTVCGLDCP